MKAGRVCTIALPDLIIVRHVVPGRCWRSESNRLRRQRFTGFHIAKITGLSRATVSRILRLLGLNLRNADFGAGLIWLDMSSSYRIITMFCCELTLASTHKMHVG